MRGVAHKESKTALQTKLVMAEQRIRARSKATRSYQKRLETLWRKYLGGPFTAWAFWGAAAYSAPEILGRKRNDEKAQL